MSEIKIIISEHIKPPLGGMGGSIHDWQRSGDPFHSSCFPDEFKDAIDLVNPGSQKLGWMALDYCGNEIGFIADGKTYILKSDD